MRFALTFFLLTLFYSLSFSQNFPNIKTEDLNGKSMNLPSDLKGTKSIIFLAFTQEAEDKLEHWYGPVYTMFIDQTGFNSMAYDCEVKLLMMFTGPTQSAANKVIASIKKNVDPSMADLLLFYQGDISEEMKSLEIKKKDDCYVIVIDENGKILMKETGNYTEAKLDKIASLVEID